MMTKPPTNRQNLDDAKRLLASTPVIRSACELDVLVFLYRHPRALLRIEQLAAFVGYDMKHVATIIDAFIEAGILERTQNPNHAARMYLLVLDGPHGGGFTELLRLASTRKGRQQILPLLGRAPSPSQFQAAPVDIGRERAKRRLFA